MEILARFNGRKGQITIAQERKTGARLYRVGRLVSTMCVSWCGCSKAHRISFYSVAGAVRLLPSCTTGAVA